MKLLVKLLSNKFSEIQIILDTISTIKICPDFQKCMFVFQYYTKDYHIYKNTYQNQNTTITPSKLVKANKICQSYGLPNCKAYIYDFQSMSLLHLSYAKEKQNEIGKCQEMTESFLITTNPTSFTGAKHIATTMMNTINPI